MNPEGWRQLVRQGPDKQMALQHHAEEAHYGAALKMRMALGADRTGPMGDFSLTDAELALDQSKNWAKRKK